MFASLVQYSDLMCFTPSKLFQPYTGAREIELPASFIPRVSAWVVHARILCAECRQGVFWICIFPVSHIVILPFTFLTRRTWQYVCDGVLADMAQRTWRRSNPPAPSCSLSAGKSFTLVCSSFSFCEMGTSVPICLREACCDWSTELCLTWKNIFCPRRSSGICFLGTFWCHIWGTFSQVVTTT